MPTSIDIENLTREEKLQLMHKIWETLVKDESQIESPKWHKSLLQETEKRFRSGKDRVVDWSEAKKELRKHFK